MVNNPLVLLQMWAEIYEQVICALFFFEAIMVVLLAIKKSYSAILVSRSCSIHTTFAPIPSSLSAAGVHAACALSQS